MVDLNVIVRAAGYASVLVTLKDEIANPVRRRLPERLELVTLGDEQHPRLHGKKASAY
jgi:hypothetical protein